MSTKAKGDILEKLVLLVEKSISHQPGTVFQKKYHRKDRDGVMREIDLFVTTTVNGKKVQYAFECKNHVKAVSLRDITDFHSKIEDSGIPGYFVTTGSYQSGAAEKAKGVGIQLLTLKEREPGNDDIAKLHLFTKKFEIVKVSHGASSASLDGAALQKIMTECVECITYFGAIVEKTVVPVLAKNFDDMLDERYPEFSNITGIEQHFGKDKAKEVGLVFEHEPGINFTHNNKDVILLKQTILGLRVWHEKVPNEMLSTDCFLYNEYDSSEAGTLFSKSEFLVGEQKIVLCISHVNGEPNARHMITADESAIETAVTQQAVSIGNADRYKLIFSDEPSAQ